MATASMPVRGKLKTNVSGTLSLDGRRSRRRPRRSTARSTSSVAGGPVIDRDRPFSLSLWIRPGNAPSGCVISKMDGTAEARGFEIIWYKSQPRINFVHHWGRDSIEVVAQQKFSGKQWRHLAVTYDGSAKAAGFRMYVDGGDPDRRSSRYADRVDGDGRTVAHRLEGDRRRFRRRHRRITILQSPARRRRSRPLYWRESLGRGRRNAAGRRTRDSKPNSWRPTTSSVTARTNYVP